MTVFVLRILRDQDLCLRLEELHLNTIRHPNISEWMQQLFCSLQNLRIFKQNDGHTNRSGRLNIGNLTRSHWICNNLETLHLALGSVSRWREEEVKCMPETIEQRKSKILRVYELFGALKR